MKVRIKLRAEVLGDAAPNIRMRANGMGHSVGGTKRSRQAAVCQDLTVPPPKTLDSLQLH